ncbi:MAG TPA: response regulator [Clostridia bacterium]|nr:response regulator [Clostridia bacterium]
MFNVYGKVVLIVDDSPSIRREVRAILQKEGITVREAGTEFGLFNTIDEYGEVVDMILMDLTLNETTGFDLVAKIRTVERLKSIPIIMLTQHSDRKNVLKAKDLGINGYMVKPINSQLLVERVRKTLEESFGEAEADSNQDNSDPDKI